MRRTFTDRLARIERHLLPVAGGLPVVLIAPDGPEGDAVRAEAEALRARGFAVVLASSSDAAIDQLVELCAP